MQVKLFLVCFQLLQCVDLCKFAVIDRYAGDECAQIEAEMGSISTLLAMFNNLDKLKSRKIHKMIDLMDLNSFSTEHFIPALQVSEEEMSLPEYVVPNFYHVTKPVPKHDVFAW